MTTAVGFVGVGVLATAMIRGIRQSWPDRAIHLSPRSEAASRALAEGDSLITRHTSNAAVVAASDIVFLTMLPPQLDAATRGLPFRAGQIVVSCVASTPLADVQALVDPATACRAIPLPTMARREGPILLYAIPPAVRTLLEGQGDLIEAADEAEFGAYLSGSIVMSTYFRLQLALIAGLEGRGVPRAGAEAYVTSFLRAQAETSLHTDPAHLASLVAEHETPGGLNERVRRTLEQRGWFDEVAVAIATTMKLRRDELTTISE
jgi:pyrroline-5-carboxylate reductase